MSAAPDFAKTLIVERALGMQLLAVVAWLVSRCVSKDGALFAVSPIDENFQSNCWGAINYCDVSGKAP